MTVSAGNETKPKKDDPEPKQRDTLLPEGTCLLIPPQHRDHEAKPAARSTGRPSAAKRRRVNRHWIACLFTSKGYGRRGKSSTEDILENTRLAVEDLRRQVEEVRNDGKKEAPEELWGCRFNAGLFGVEWERTKKVLEEVGLEVTVITPEGTP